MRASRRYRTAVHEAAHAVVFRLAGVGVDDIELAPVGVATWTTTSHRGVQINNLRGICRTRPPIVALHEICESDDLRTIAQFKQHCANSTRQDAEYSRRAVRAYVCGLLAGYAANAIYLGHIKDDCSDDFIRNEDLFSYYDFDDLWKAIQMCRFLPFRCETEYCNLMKVTIRALFEPQIWKQVIDLATALYDLGKIDDDALAPYLPKPRAGWPTAR